MIVKINAVVLKGMDYLESSKILTLYTREYGIMKVIIKGARRSIGKYGASLEPLSHISAIVYLKDSRDIQVLTEAALIKSFGGIQKDYEKLFTALSVVELLYSAVKHQEKNENLYRLLLESIESINSATKSTIPLLYYFEVQFVKLFGSQPVLEGCAGCRRDLTSLEKDGERYLFFSCRKGVYSCSRCDPPGGELIKIGLNIIKTWNLFDNLQINEVIQGEWDSVIFTELESLLSRYLRLHLPGVSKLRAKRFLNENLENI